METKNLKIVIKNIDELKEYENNPRKNEEAVDAVVNSIKEFGFKVPAIIDSNNVLICGHTRVKACKKLGIVDIPCIVADDLTEDQIKAFRLADNRTAEIATWDFTKLKEEFDSIDLDLDAFGFEDLKAKLNKDLEEDEFDEAQALPESPYSKKGDIYLLGKHRLLCGDSTKPESFKALLQDKKADLIFTDPPYNVDYEGTAGKIQNDKQSDEGFLNFLKSAFASMFGAIKYGGSFYCCHPDVESYNFITAYKAAGFKLSQCLVWVKNAFVFGRKDYQSRHELILYGWREGASHYFIDDRTQDTIWEYNKPKVNDLHPTMKPVALVGRAITNSSKKGEIVLDPFGGSGTTLIAADELNRAAYLIELDEKYVDVIVKRYLSQKGKADCCYLLRDGKKTPLSEIADFAIKEESEFLN